MKKKVGRRPYFSRSLKLMFQRAKSQKGFIKIIFPLGILSLLLAVGSTFFVHSLIQTQARLRFENRTAAMSSFIQGRINGYSEAFYGAQGLFAASQSIDEHEWQAYVEKLDVPNNFTGMTGFSFAKRVLKEEVKEYPAEIHPFTEKEEYYPIQFLTQFVKNPSVAGIGTDISTDESRKNAIDRAIGENMLIATPVVIGITTGLPVFSLYAPVYKNDANITEAWERKNQAVGIISASFRTDEFFQALKADPIFDENIAFEIHEMDSDGKIIFASGTKKDASSVTWQQTIAVAGRVWIIQYSADQEYGLASFEKFLPVLIGTISALLCLLLVLFVRNLATGKERALVLADQLTQDLRVSMEALAREKAKAEAILSSMGEGVAVADAEGKLTYWNSAAEKILGIQMDKTPKDEWSDTYGVFYPDETTPMPGDEQALAKVLGGETIEPMHEFIRNPALPQGRHILVTSRAIRNKKNELSGGVAVFRDITKETEIDKAKSEFVSLASHQLRTPLSAVHWYTEMLLAGDGGTITPLQKKYLTEIYTSNQRMIEMVNALLDVSRLEVGTIAFNPEPTDAVSVMESVLHEQEPALREKNLNLKKYFAPNLPLLLADPKLLRMVFQNLLSNAIKYTGNDGKISLSLAQNEKGHTLFHISDSGYGIPEHQKEKIFSKLFRADNVRLKDTEGTGFGLYIVKSVVERSGWKIWFDSIENTGTDFYIEFLPEKE